MEIRKVYSLIVVAARGRVKKPLYAFDYPAQGPYVYYPEYHLQTGRFAMYCIPNANPAALKFPSCYK